jgi:biopolymer transport protein TolR
MSKVTRRKPMSEINVVPYIDVMLVLLVIFMVTAPLMTQGIKVDLPDANSEAIDVDADQSFLIVTIRADQRYYLNTGDEEQAVALETIGETAMKIISANPAIRVLVEGDQSLPYGVVVTLMDELQRAGVEGVGLVTEPSGG